MINSISTTIANFLCRNNAINKKERDIYVYGFEILISNILGLIITLTLGVLFNKVWWAVVFYLTFVSIREYIGGYHAGSYLKCNLCFATVIALVFLLTLITNTYWKNWFIVVAFMFHFSVILKYAPVDNKNKPLTTEEKKKHKKTGAFISLGWFVVAFILFYICKELSAVISITVVISSLLLLIAIIRQKCRS